MNDNFEKILIKISEHYAIDLHPDKNNACAIRCDDKITVQLEMDKDEENLLIFCAIASIPAGTYRKNIFIQALQENDRFPYIAKFGYFEEENSLAIYIFFDFIKMKIEVLLDYLSIFVDLAILYYDAIEKGNLLPDNKL